MVARSTVAVAIALAGTWAVAGPAAALEPGVFVDPDSPAGKEYSIPLSVLRGGASGRPAVAGEPQPLFGIGITPASAHGVGIRPEGRGQQSQRRRRAQPAHRTRGSARRQAGGAAASGARARGAAGTSGRGLAGISTRHGSPATAVALFSAAVVLGGLALGALLVAARRRLD